MTTRAHATIGWALAAFAFLLPAIIFLLAVALQTLATQPALASTAHDIVMSFAGKQWTLWGPLLLEPLLAIVWCTIGLQRAEAAGAGRPVVLAALRVLATLILAIVIVHMAAN